MATIASIIRKGGGKAGSNRSWEVVRDHTEPRVFSLWHYRTLMLRWHETVDGNVVLDISTGHGSVSDQGGMNTAFKVLDLPYRFDRDWRGGGARITELGMPLSNGFVSIIMPERSPDSMRWTPELAEHEIAQWRKLLDS